MTRRLPDDMENNTDGNNEDTRRIDSLVFAARRSDDPLLGALSLVLAANHDYAKSVSSLLTTDLSQGKSLLQIKEKLNALLQKTDALVKSQEELLKTLDTLPHTHKALIEEAIKAQNKVYEGFITEKFSKVFLIMGLQKNGDSFGEADNLVRKIRLVINKQVVTIIVSMGLYNLALWLLSYAGKLVK